MTGNPVQAAKHFGRDAATIRKWIQGGCPVLRKGGKGPGQAAVLDFDAVAEWLGVTGSKREPVHTVNQTLETIACAFADCVTYDRVEERTGATMAEAAALFILCFDRLAKLMGKKYAWETLPKPICALRRIYYAASDTHSPCENGGSYEP